MGRLWKKRNVAEEKSLSAGEESRGRKWMEWLR